MKNFIFFFFMILSFHGFGQVVEFQVVSSKDKLPVPFAMVGIENTDQGVMTDENGKAEFDFTNISDEANVLVDMIGYELFRMNVESFKNQKDLIIQLVPEYIELKSATIFDKKKFRQRNVGPNSKSVSMFFHIASDESDEHEKFRELAVHINKGKKRAKILNINLNFAKFEHSKPVPYRFVLYEVEDGKPGKVINQQDIVGYFSSEDMTDRFFTLNLESQDIWIEGDFFVSLQLLSKDYEGSIDISASMFHKSFYRFYYGDWEKMPLSLAPAINVDVLIQR